MGDVQAEISKITGIDTASLASSAAGGNITESDVEEQLAAAPTLTEDLISQLVDALLPLAQKELPTKDADGNGMISGQCCAQMEPVVTDLNNYGKLIAGIMDKLQCSALNNLVFYPSSE